MDVQPALSQEAGTTPVSSQSPTSANTASGPPANAAITTSAPVEAEDPNKVPEGVQPLFLATPTCEIFKLRPGTDISAESPLKKLKKADILADIQTRRAISDFQPYKDSLNAYPGEELLIVLDFEWKFGQNFYICMTPEAAEKILNPPKPKDAIPEEGSIDVDMEKKKHRRTGWISLGSEKEVEEEQALPTRPLAKVQMKRRRALFCGDFEFQDVPTDNSYIEFKSYKDVNFDLHRIEVNAAIQCVPFMKDQSTQYSKFRPKNATVQYTPMELNPALFEDALNNKEFSIFIQESLVLFDEALKNNLLFDVFADYHSKLGQEDLGIDQGSQVVLQEYQSFTDLRNSKDRSITCVEWHPHIKGIVAMSCVQRLTIEERVENGFNVRSRQSLIIFWSTSDPIHPQLLLDAPDDVVSFRFNPTNPNIIIGGCINGQILLWDITEYQDLLKYNTKSKADNPTETVTQEKASEAPFVRYIASSAIELGHKSAITDLQWLPKQVEGDIQPATEHGTFQFVTVSLDCYVDFWDLRFKKDYKSLDLTWKPIFRASMGLTEGSSDYGLTRISLDAQLAEDLRGSQELDLDPRQTPLTSKFFCGTEEGDLIYANWLPDKKEKEDRNNRIELTLPCHSGAISDLHRSPFFSDVILSVGGTAFQVWKENVTDGPLVSSGYSSTSLTVGRWSPSRPGVFFIGRQDGAVEIWDLLDRSHAPIAIHNVSANPVASLSVSVPRSRSFNQFLAAGDDDGTLYVFEISKALRKPQKSEKQSVRTFFDREFKRLGYVEERKKIRSTVGGKKEAAKEPTVEVEKKELSQKETDENDEIFEKLYFQMEKTFLDSYARETESLQR